MDSTLTRIAHAQAEAMAAKDKLDHDVLGGFTSRVHSVGAGRAAENIAYGYDNFEKTLGQWIDSSEHRKNLLLSKATRVGIASAKDASGKPFAGFASSDGVWAVALMCSTCQVPAPIALAVLNPTP